MVHVIVKEDPNEERYENEKALIPHVNKNDTWIMDSGCTHIMIGDIDEFDKFKEYSTKV